MPERKEKTVKSRRFLTRTAIVVAVLSLAACQKQPEGEAAPGTPTAAKGSNGPDAAPGMAVSNGVLVLPAVKGNPGVAYFSVTNGSQQATSLAAIHIDGVGKTEMHETQGGTMAPMNWADIPAGQTLKFEPGGKHVMLFDLTDKVKAGGTAEMTLTFSGGDTISTPLKVQAAGGA
jgi:copper(I)-binding protein